MGRANERVVTWRSSPVRRQDASQSIFLFREGHVSANVPLPRFRPLRTGDGNLSSQKHNSGKIKPKTQQLGGGRDSAAKSKGSGKEKRKRMRRGKQRSETSHGWERKTEIATGGEGGAAINALNCAGVIAVHVGRK